MSTIHPFTRAGFGPAPFRCTGMTVEKYQACQGAPIQPGTSCDYCGTGIMYAFWIENADSSRRFKVGCDCVAKTNADVSGFKVEKAKHDKTIRDERNKAARERRAAKREAEHAERQKVWAREREERLNAYLATDEGAKIASFLLNHETGFLGEMNASLHKWGSLTAGQHAAVLKIIAQNAEREARAASSSYLGEVGKPLEVEVTVIAQTSRTYDAFPPRTVYWHLLHDAAGNVLTFRGVHLAEKGARVKATFTVKAHEEYKGTKQTVLQRPRKVVTL